jgi:hypothetical protein
LHCNKRSAKHLTKQKRQIAVGERSQRHPADLRIAARQMKIHVPRRDLLKEHSFRKVRP